MTIGQYIEKKRATLGVKAEEVAKVVGGKAYNDIVTDRRLPTHEEFSSIAHVLNFSGSMGAKYRQEITLGYRRIPIELEGDTAKTVAVLSGMVGTTPTEFINRVLEVAATQLVENMNLIERMEYAKRVQRS